MFVGFQGLCNTLISKNGKNNKKHIGSSSDDWNTCKYLSTINHYRQHKSSHQSHQKRIETLKSRPKTLQIPAQKYTTHTISYTKTHQHAKKKKKTNKFPMEFPNSMLFKHPLFPNKSWRSLSGCLRPTSSEVPSLVGRPSTCKQKLIEGDSSICIYKYI